MALSFIPFAFPGAPGVRCAFQTRDWGVSEGPYGGGNIAYTVGDDPLRVSANRLDLAASLELAEIAELDQIHGDTLVFDPPASPLERFVEPPAFPKGDGLATDKPGIGLIIKTADCQPVLVAHKGGRHIAAFHIGWRGNRLRFLQSGIAAFCGLFVWNMLVALTAAALLTRLFFKATGSIWAGGFLNALIITLFATSNTVVSINVLP